MNGSPSGTGRDDPDRVPRGCVWLGDLARALQTLAPVGREDEERIARLLGLGPDRGADPGSAGHSAPAERPRSPEPPWEERTGTGDEAVDTRHVAEPPLPAVPARSGAGPQADREAPAAAVEPSASAAVPYFDLNPGTGTGSGTRPVSSPAPAPAAGPPTLRPLAITTPRPSGSSRSSGPSLPSTPLPRPDARRMRLRPPHTPLLAPMSGPALLGAVLAGWVPEGDVEADLAVELLAGGLPLTVLPRRPLRTLRHGVQILVDHGPALEPFSRDQSHLCSTVRSLMGDEHTEVLRFAYSPLRPGGAGPGPKWTWQKYRPPPRDTAVLVLSDCGAIGPPGDPDRSTEAEWHAFADLVRRHGARPLALVPLADRRLPPSLTRTMPVIGWDRGTTVGHATARVRPGCRRYGTVASSGPQG